MSPITFSTACELARHTSLHDGRMEQLIKAIESDPMVEPTDEFCDALAAFAEHMNVKALAKALEPLFAHYGLLPSPEETLIKVLAEVRAERRAQYEKWGQQDRPSLPADFDPSMAKLNERVAKAMVETAAAESKLSFHDILLEEVYEAIAAESEEEMRAELIQVAAVAVSWVEAIDRRRHGKTP